jgi:curved DNA-binding protein CbpA
MKNYYNILGVSKESNFEEIRKSYKLHASKLHPDKHSGDKFFDEKFKEINEAYEILSNSVKRKNYDNEHNFKKLIYDDTLRKKEEILRKKENELKIRERKLLKRENQLKLKLIEIKKKEEELIIKKVEGDDNYLHIQAPIVKDNVKNIFVKTWLKSVGEPVKNGDIIVKIVSDHAEKIDIYSNSDGFLIYAVQPGEKVPVGGTLAIISK